MVSNIVWSPLSSNKLLNCKLITTYLSTNKFIFYILQSMILCNDMTNRKRQEKTNFIALQHKTYNKPLHIIFLFKSNEEENILHTGTKASLDQCSTNTKKTLLVGQNSPKNTYFFAQQFYNLCEQKFSNLRPLLSAKRHLSKVNKWKNLWKTFFATLILHPLWAKVSKSETTSFHYFAPRTIKI